MFFIKFIKWADHCTRKISLFHVILISCLFALISVVNHNGGDLNAEMYLRLPFYLSDTPLLNKLFDSRILEQDMYQARELSYFLDFLDSKFIELSIENGFPHFLSLTHYLFSIAIGCLLWLFCVKELNLKPLLGLGLVVLFWTSPSIFLGGSFFRTAKIGVALLVAILFYVIYKVAVVSTKDNNFQISKKVWLLYSVAIFSIAYLDQQGLFLAITVLVFLIIWGLFIRHKNVYIMLSIGVAAILLHELYRYTIAPQLTFMLNGYWPNFDYQTLSIQSFIQNLAYYLSAGFLLYVETFRFLIGNPPQVVGFGLLILFILFPLFYLYTNPDLSSNHRKFFLLALVELLITNFLLLVFMNALMVLRHPALISLTGGYYWLPTTVMLAMTLAILIDIFYKSRIPKWLVILLLCFAIIGNIVALSKNKAAQSQFPSTLINALKDVNSLDDVNNPLIENNAVFEYFKYKKKSPPVGNTYIEKADYYTKLGQYRRAIENFNNAIDLSPNDFKTYNNRGNLYFTIHYMQNALADYKKAIHLNPNCIDAYNNRGNAYTELRQFKLAIEDYNKVIYLNPNRVDAYNNRGISYLMQGNNLGCGDFQKACELGDCTMIEEAKALRYCQ